MRRRRARRKPITEKTTEVVYDGEYSIWKGYKFKGKKRTIPTLADVKIDLWENYCREHVKKRDGYICISCGSHCSGFNRQGGHFEPVATGGALLHYHPHNVHVQCGGCNAKEGNRTEYFPAMERKYGRKYVDKLLLLKRKTIQADTIFYEKVRAYYEQDDEKGLVKFLNEYE